MSRGYLSAGRRRWTRRRQPSLLGVLLVLAGLFLVLNLFFPPLVNAVGVAFAFWPVLFIALGGFLLVHRPGWLRQLDFHAPSMGAAVDRPRRVLGLISIGLGALLLPFTLRLLDERILGALVLILLGVLLIWRRAR